MRGCAQVEAGRALRPASLTTSRPLRAEGAMRVASFDDDAHGCEREIRRAVSQARASEMPLLAGALRQSRLGAHGIGVVPTQPSDMTDWGVGVLLRPQAGAAPACGRRTPHDLDMLRTGYEAVLCVSISSMPISLIL